MGILQGTVKVPDDARDLSWKEIEKKAYKDQATIRMKWKKECML